MGFSKLWADVCGRPLIAHAIQAARLAKPTELIIVVAPDRVSETKGLVPDACVVPGGARRRDSVAAGLAASKARWLAVHHAARALAPPELFARGLQPAHETAAAGPAISPKHTIKR